MAQPHKGHGSASTKFASKQVTTLTVAVLHTAAAARCHTSTGAARHLGCAVLPPCRTHLHGDDALLANLLHGARDELADLALTVGADGAHLRNLFSGADHLGARLEHLWEVRSDASMQVQSVV
eukprot:GHRQ01036862.1.p1 GENE.GHRQ01036862.1~~GHRQ01036862.1.p1  ORF type:complete len:123 (+),score=24.00 GHRQ01036862.1:96-464(+)